MDLLERFIVWVRGNGGDLFLQAAGARWAFPKAPSSGGERLPAALPAGVAAFRCWNDMAVSPLQAPRLTAPLALLGLCLRPSA